MSAFREGILRTINCKQDYVFMPVIAEDITDVHEVQTARIIDSVISCDTSAHIAPEQISSS